MTPEVLSDLRGTAQKLKFAIEHERPVAVRIRLETRLRMLLKEALKGTKMSHLSDSVFEIYVPNDGEFNFEDLDRDLRDWAIRGSPPHRLTGKVMEDALGM